MNGYSIYTLWGEPTWEAKLEPVEAAIAADFFERREWRVVVERQNDSGVVLQRDVTHGLTIGEALETKKNLVQTYVEDGFLTDDDLVLYAIGQYGKTVIYLDAEPGAGNEKSHADGGE